MTARGLGLLTLTALSLLILTAGCGPARPGAITPTLPPASLWQLHYEAGIKAYQQGRYAEAQTQLEIALKEAEQLRLINLEDPKAPPTPDPGVPATLKALGDVFMAQGKFRDAEASYRRALEITNNTAGPDSAFAGMVLHSLGVLAMKEGRMGEADLQLNQAARIEEKQLGAGHPVFAASLKSLGDLYAAQGKRTEAELYYKRALGLREAALGSEHPDVAESLDGLVALYFAQGNVAQAKALHKRALAIRVKALGPDHPSIAASLEQFAAMVRGTDGMATAPVGNGGAASPGPR